MNIAGIGIFAIVSGVFILLVGAISYFSVDFYLLFVTSDTLLEPEDAKSWMLWGLGFILIGSILIIIQHIIGKWLEERDRKSGKLRI